MITAMSILTLEVYYRFAGDGEEKKATSSEHGEAKSVGGAVDAPATAAPR